MTAQATADREVAQEIANREGYTVHVGCGGEVWSERHGRLRCHACDRAVDGTEVVEPQIQSARCDEGECEWHGTIEAARLAAPPEYQAHGITACPACGSLAIREGKQARRGKVGTR